MSFVTHAMKLFLAVFIFQLHYIITSYAYEPPRSTLMIDVGNNKVLFEEAPDELRHPASLTKMMTLYLLFEALERGDIKLDTGVVGSRHSADRAPSRLGHAKGEVIPVDLAIDALVVRSANDVAAAVAELLAGTEEAFAKKMTQKADALGMKNTVYKNASGLPDKEQVTTARDQAILGLALKTDFPDYFPRFSVPVVTYKDRTWNSHNKLIVKVPTVTGIKTGFINASGFNIVTYSEEEQTDHLVVVMGGRSAKERDQTVIDLLAEYKSDHKVADMERVPSSSSVEAVEAKQGNEQQKLAVRETGQEISEDVSIPPYAIQIGALPNQKNAMERLMLVKPVFKDDKSSLRQYTVPLETSNGTVYRARIVGFESMQAAFDACDVMESRKIECMALIQK